jgi:hypothetical protein
MEKYRKLIVVAVGLAATFIPELAGFDDDAGELFDLVIAVLTAFGVYRVPNAIDPERLARGDVEIQR